MIALLVPVELHVIGYHLLVSDVFEGQEIRGVLVVLIAVAVRLAVKKARLSSMGATHR